MVSEFPWKPRKELLVKINFNFKKLYNFLRKNVKNRRNYHKNGSSCKLFYSTVTDFAKFLG